MKLSARSGLTVIVPDVEYGVLLTKHSEHTKSYILNCAGRVLHHRNELANIRKQKLTTDELQQIESLAKSLAVQSAIEQILCDDMGYGKYVEKNHLGGMVPESYYRAVDRAKQQIDIGSIVVTNGWRDYAMNNLGFYTQRDEEWSRNVSEWCKWDISAPTGWGEPGNTLKIDSRKKSL